MIDASITQASITEIEAPLKQQLKKYDYAEIQNTIKVKETAKKQILHQRKFKKFNTMKYKPKPIAKTTNSLKETNYLTKHQLLKSLPMLKYYRNLQKCIYKNQ